MMVTVMSVSAANLTQMTLNCCCPFPPKYPLENAPVYMTVNSETLLNKPVDCVLLGISGA